MNINEIKISDDIKFDNIFDFILDKQKILLKKYWKKPLGNEIHTEEWQKELRLFTKYTIEEIAEAMEELYDRKDIDPNQKFIQILKDESYIHFIEEIIDSLHFITEKCLLSWLDSYKTISRYKTYTKKIRPLNNLNEFKVLITDIVYKINITDNFLRNKEWKRTNVVTNVELYLEGLIDAYFTFYDMLYSLWLDDKLIAYIYSKKHEVNNFRIRSNY